jgi:hypothetical protein
MPLEGQHPVPKRVLRLVARLVAIHHATHPARIARRFGLSKRYVYMQFANYHEHEMAGLAEALSAYSGRGGFDEAECGSAQGDADEGLCPSRQTSRR